MNDAPSVVSPSSATSQRAQILGSKAPRVRPTNLFDGKASLLGKNFS